MGEFNEQVNMEDWLNHAEYYLGSYSGSSVEYFWELNYTIKSETINEITKYYLVIVIQLDFTPKYYDSDFSNIDLPLEFKLIGTIHNPEEYDENI